MTTKIEYDAAAYGEGDIARGLQNIIGSELAALEFAFDDVDYEPVLEETLKGLEADHTQFFEADKDATGEAWPPLAPSTVKRKGHDTILEETGAMRESLTGNSANAIREIFDGPQQGLSFGTSDEKAPWHQRGTTRMPQRAPVGVTEERLNILCDQVADTTVNTMVKP